jgi:glycosyltransferase involved in cell wall biosynthesis
VDAGGKGTEGASPRTDEAMAGFRIALLTGGQDRHYSYGLATALAPKRVGVDFVGSDELDSPELRATPSLSFLNLRGSQERNASRVAKVERVLRYYGRLLKYAAVAEPEIFHVLWNNKIEAFDRTLLMIYYRLLGKRIVHTAHNVNAARRDSKDGLLNRLTLKTQYRLCHNVFVHTEKMKQELHEQFGVREDRVTVIPYGINNAVPDTALTPREARARLGLAESDRAILFFGQIGHYKGLDYLVTAFEQLLASDPRYRLVVAGKPKPGAREYWDELRTRLEPHVAAGRAILNVRFIPDAETELYFKGTDLFVLPYREIFQSGILFLGYSFGLPAVAADVGALRDDVIEGKTGFLCRPHDPDHLSKTIATYFESPLYADLERRRVEIRDYVTSQHSWDVVADMTRDVYLRLLKSRGGSPQGEHSHA